MSQAPKILAFAGSTRRDSFNRKLISSAVRGAEAAGATVTLIDLNDYPLPLYNGDDETQNGIPENARQLKILFKQHQGLLLSCPEYNSSITPLLKNTIDWVSRPLDDEPGSLCFKGKAVGLLSASPGALGGLRGLVHVRQILVTLGCLVLAEQQAVGRAGAAFDETGELRDNEMRTRVESIGAQLAQLLQKLA